MIIGNGDIAKVLKKVDREDLLFFASGVSNSGEKRKEEFWREEDLLRAQDTTQHIVYFSTLSIFYKESPYVFHKLKMEGLVRTLFESYTIVRLGNIDWGNNPHTLINYIKNRIKKGKPFEVRDEYRYVISEEEFLHWMKLIPSFSCEMNLPGKMMKVASIVRKYCQVERKETNGYPRIYPTKVQHQA